MEKIQKKIYNMLPYPLKFVALNYVGYKNSKDRYTKNFYKYYEEYCNLWVEDIDAIKDYQKNQLKALLAEAYQHSEWYSNIMKDLNIDLSTISEDPFGVLETMPILKKSERKLYPDKLINTKRDLAGIGYTSGTSGSPTINYIDKESINRSFALWRRFHHTIGLKLKVRQVRFSGKLIVRPDLKKPPFWMYNYSERQLLMSTYHLTEKNLSYYIKKLNKFKPKLIDGFPSAIYVISRYINKNNLNLTFTPTAIAVTAETLYDYQRIEIEKAFNCRVFNQYASSEGSPFITECIKGNLHLNLDSGIFEFINNKGEKALPNEIAQLVVTSFTNLKTPLIRYNIEDTVLLSDSKKVCTCGCAMPIIEKLTGREDDILWTEEKGYVGRITTAFTGYDDGIIKYQIIQETPHEVAVKLIVSDKYDKKMQLNLIKNLENRLGKNVKYKINVVSNIPIGPNGKFSAVKRNFKIEI